MNVMSIVLNLTHKDPVKRKIFTNKDFRIGLSYAINRKEIVNSALPRQGEPCQMAPVPESPFYDKEFATPYLAYDPAKAKSHLDKAGYTETDSSGIRLGPDGKPISFIMEFVPEFRSEWSDMLTLVRNYWRRSGSISTSSPRTGRCGTSAPPPTNTTPACGPEGAVWR